MTTSSLGISNSGDAVLHHRFRALGTQCQITLSADAVSQASDVFAQVEHAIKSIEHRFSRYRDDSVTSLINRSAGNANGIEVDDETAAWLDYAQVCYQQSDGLFDITSGVLRRAWDFRADKLPTEEAIQELLPLVGWDKVRWERPHIVLPIAGMQLDFGGFGKEYAADLAANICYQAGVCSGVVDLGGDLHILGAQQGGRGWRIGVCDPRQPQRALVALDLFHGGMATSGDYERFMLVNGKRYCHILDPRTGWPVENSFASVTVLASKCIVAGTATTIAMLKGRQDGLVWLEELQLPYMIVEQDGTKSGPLTTRSS